MRITIETGVTPNAIKIEGDYTIDELLEALGKLYPDFTWKDITICEHTLPNPTINTSSIRNSDIWKTLKDTQVMPVTNPPPFPGTGITYTANKDQIDKIKALRDDYMI